MSRLRDLRRDERGVGLIELLATMAIGTVVMLALFSLVDVTLRSATRTHDRTDGSQRGRLALEQMVQRLRSSVCLGAAPLGATPIAAPTTAPSTATEVSFYSDLHEGTGTNGVGTNAFEPELVRLRYDGPTRSIVETRQRYQQPPGGGAPQPVTGSTLTTRTVASGILPPQSGRIFSYYAFAPNLTITPYDADASDELPATLTAADAARVAAVRIRFVASGGRSGGAAAARSPFDDLVAMRLVDPANPTRGTTCRA